MAEEEVQRLTGHCRWFNPSKGFGFITPEDGEEDLFVHQVRIAAQHYSLLRPHKHVCDYVPTNTSLSRYSDLAHAFLRRAPAAQHALAVEPGASS